MKCRVPILVNDYERAVDSHLAKVCGHGLRLHCKPRLADVVPVSREVLDRDDHRYALMAHFDFVVTDLDGLAELAVEFDGPRHRHDSIQIARDQRKNRICRKFALPLLRVAAPALRPADHRTLLEWILQVWRTQRDLREAWDEVYDAEETEEGWDGDLPETKLDEFDYREYHAYRDDRDEDGERGRIICAPLDAFHEARKRIGRAWSRHGYGDLDGWYGDFVRGPITPGFVALRVDDAWLLGTGRVGLRGLYPWVNGLCPPKVAQDIALLDLDRQIVEWERGRLPGMSREGVEAAVAGHTRGLMTTFEFPSKLECAQAFIESLTARGVDVDAPGVKARVYLSFLDDGPNRDFDDYW